MKKNLILCILATFFTTQQIQTSFDCSCLAGCFGWLISKCKKPSTQQNINQQVLITAKDPFQAFEEEMQPRTALSTNQLPLPEYSNIKFTDLLETSESSAPTNSLSNAAEQHSRSLSTCSSFDIISSNINSPIEEKKDK
ncbi:MAG: hypothetical protein WC747_00560 [Candidatus Babeliales bacterium]|jgi:hypothetical protein